MLHAVIMAGGSGTRFWPASRQAKPKQLLAMVGNRTMLQSTFDRLGGLISSEHVLVLTNHQLVDEIRVQLPDIPAEHIVGEPCKRDTAPCIGLAASLVTHADPEGLMVVMPSDHVIETKADFQGALRAAAKLIEERPSRIITFGIRPSYPAESFGYIQRGQEVSQGVYEVSRFREKPNLQTAQEYVASGEFYWNSGIFVWKAQTILDALKKFEPEMYSHIEKIAASIGTTQFPAIFAEEFQKIKGKSIDYAVMERYDDVLVMQAPFAWDDVGSWQSLARLGQRDTEGNTAQGRYLNIDSKEMIIRSEGDHLIVTIGMSETIVVHTPDATLVAPKSQEERVREVVKRLEAGGMLGYL